MLLGDETALYADAAYSSKQTREKLAKLGIEDQVQRKGCRGKPLSKEERTRNKAIAVTRAGGERPFSTHTETLRACQNLIHGSCQKCDDLWTGRYGSEHWQRR